ncbi:MAG: amino acid permease [Gemmatimonadetes bacterium]|nr:amino acid permease [Gemmatimonadota bacterium]
MTTDRLPRLLGPISAALFTVGWTIGSAVFRVPGQVASGAGSISASLMLWIGGGVVALCGAYCYAELSVRLPRSGSEYVYTYTAYGPFLGFLIAWATLFGAPMAVAAVARAFADYFSVIWPLGEMPRRLLAASVIAMLGGIAALSTLTSTRIAGLAGVGKLLALLALALTALLFTGTHPVAAPPPPSVGGLAALGPAFVAILWAYDGYASVAGLAGEVRTPQRTLPIGLLLGLGFIATAYVGTNIAYFHVLGFNGVATSETVAAQTLGAAIGPRAAQVIAVLVMCSTLGTVAAQCIGQSRYYLAPAEDGLFPRWLARVWPRTQTPGNAVLAMTVVAMAFVLSGGYSAIIGAYALVWYPFLAVALFGTVILRRRNGVPTGFSMPLYPLPLIVFIAGIAAMCVASVAADPKALLVALFVPATGSVVYAAGRRLSRPASGR